MDGKVPPPSLKLFSILKDISHNMYNSFAKYFLITDFLN